MLPDDGHGVLVSMVHVSWRADIRSRQYHPPPNSYSVVHAIRHPMLKLVILLSTQLLLVGLDKAEAFASIYITNTNMLTYLIKQSKLVVQNITFAKTMQRYS